MIKKLLKFTIEMFNHIESFRTHFQIPTFTEAVRQLILDGFKYNGCPLDENPRQIVGKVARESAAETHERERLEHIERYQKLMRDLGYEP